MKKYLLFAVFAGAFLQAQNNIPKITQQYKHFLEKKDVYHFSHANLQEPYTIGRYTYNDDFTRIDKFELKKTDGQNGYYTNYLEDFTYDDQDRLTQSATQENVNGTYINNDRVFYSYNADGKLDVIYSERWDTDTNKYNNHRRYTFTYNNGSEKPSQIEWEYGDSNNSYVWKKQFIDYFEYNNNGDILKITRRTTVGDENIDRRIYTYDNNGNRTGRVFQKYASARGFYDDTKYEIKYDTDGNVTERISYYIGAQGDWVTSLRVEVLSHNMDLLRKETYSFEGADYFTGAREVFIPSKNVVTAYNAYEYISPTQQYRQLTHNEFEFLEDEALSVQNQVNNVEVKLYPNPASEYFSLSTQDTKGTVSVYDMAGKQVKFFDQLQATYDIQSLPKGVYVVTLKTETTTKTFKLVKS